MISKALSFLTGYLNRELRMTFGLDDDLVVASNLTKMDGRVADNVNNKIVLSVINIEQETSVKSGFHIKAEGSSRNKVNPPLHLNIYLLVSVNFASNEYLEALRMLSAVIKTFQASSLFTKQSHPEISDPLEKLTLEIYNVPVNELSHIWNGIGAKYVPSTLYKMRMIAESDEKIKGEIPAVTGLGSDTKTE
jgi:hypothetical protein